MGEGRKKGPGGGGASLNFKVVGNPQPANPKDNTIWLNTDVKITGYSFAAEQPEEMAKGEVWLSTGKTSTIAFNAVKNGTVMVYPISAKQMIDDGILVDVTAKSWRNGAWIDLWDGSIFDGDNQYESITGGWESIPLPNSALKVSPITGGLKLEQLTGGGTGVYKTKNKVSLNGYSSLCFTGIIHRPDRYTSNLIGIKIFSEIGADVNKNVVAEYIAPIKENNIFDDQPVLDIGSLNDSYYIALFIQSSDGKYIDLKKLRIK